MSVIQIHILWTMYSVELTVITAIFFLVELLQASKLQKEMLLE